MAWITTIAISNAVIASFLGLIAYFVGRRAKSAAVGHALWVLVLLKLVTPPVLELPLPVLPAAPGAEVADAPHPAWNTANGTLTAKLATPQMPTSNLPSDPATDSPVFNRATLQFWFLRVWFAGIILYGIYQLYVTWQMCRLMKLAEPDCRIDRAMHRIAKRANVQNYPTARVVPWVGSPMLWGFGGTSVIVLPEQLFDRLDDKAADTLMQHELAHFQRGDQWIRILEAIASTLFWWHPVVWMAICEIEVYEEQCCDAWVVKQDQDNRRKYAEALLDTVDFISDTPDSGRPLAASGLGRVPLLQRRIRAIMQGDQQALNAGAKVGLCVLLLLVPLQPQLVEATFQQPASQQQILENSDSFSLPPIDPDAEFVAGVKQQPEPSLAEKVETAAPIPAIDYAIADSVFGRYQLIATSGYRVRLREVVTSSSFDLAQFHISCAEFAPPRDEVPEFAAGCLDGSVYVFDCLTGEPKDRLAKLNGKVHSLVYHPSGEVLVAGGEDGLIHIDLVGNSSRTLDISFGPIRSIRYSPDGEKLAVVTDTTWKTGTGGRVDIWNATTYRHERTIRCPNAVGVAGFDSLGHVLTAEWNGTVRTWSAEGRQLLVQRKPKDAISAAAFSPSVTTLEALCQVDTPLPN